MVQSRQYGGILRREWEKLCNTSVRAHCSRLRFEPLYSSACASNATSSLQKFSIFKTTAETFFYQTYIFIKHVEISTYTDATGTDDNGKEHIMSDKTTTYATWQTFAIAQITVIRLLIWFQVYHFCRQIYDMDASITSMDSAHRRSPPISTEPKLCMLDCFIPSCTTPLAYWEKRGEGLGVLLRGSTLFSKEATEQRIQRMVWRCGAEGNKTRAKESNN